MYIIENWVWQCWLGLELVLHNAAVVSLLNWILSSFVSLPLAGRPYSVATKILLPARVEDFTASSHPTVLASL